MGCEPINSSNSNKHNERSTPNKHMSLSFANSNYSNAIKQPAYSNKNKDKDINYIQTNEPDNDKEVTVVILLGFASLWKRAYSPNTILSAIVEEFKEEKCIDDFWKFNDINWFANNSPIDLSKPLKALVPIEAQSQSQPQLQSIEVKLAFYVSGLTDVATDSKAYIQRELNVIGRLLSNPFDILIYNKKHKGFSLAQYTPDIINENHLNTLDSNNVSYCNGRNCLFLSHGTHKASNRNGMFFIFNLDNLHIESYRNDAVLSMRSHSMIYIPRNYVFMIGGDTNAAMYYDINERDFNQWGELVLKQIEPALAFVDNKFLYSFSHKGNEDAVAIQRTNLRSSPKWIEMTPRCFKDYKFTQRFFGVCCMEDKDDALIFLGGIQHDYDPMTIQSKHCFGYNCSNNELFETMTQFEEIDLSEKCFLPFNRKYYFAIPNAGNRMAKVGIYNHIKRKIDLITYEPQYNTNAVSKDQDKSSPLKKFIAKIPSVDDITSSTASTAMIQSVLGHQMDMLNGDEEVKGGGRGRDDIGLLNETVREYNKGEGGSTMSKDIPLIITESQITSQIVSIAKAGSAINQNNNDTPPFSLLSNNNNLMII